MRTDPPRIQKEDVGTGDLLGTSGPTFIDRVLAASIRDRLLVLLGVVLLVAAGVHSALALPIDAIPDVTNVQVQILTNAPGLGPEEIERFVTTPVEASMGGVPDVVELRSLSRFGLSVVTVVFEEGTEIWWARQAIGERLVEAREAIPEGYGEPEMGPISSGLGEIYQFEVRGDGLSAMELRDVLDWQIAPRLRGVPGVVEVNAFGGELRTYEVSVRPDTLAAHGLVLADVYEALERNNAAAGGGYLQKGREQVLVRGEALLGSLEDIAAVVVATTDAGTPVTIGTVGEVRHAPMLRQGAVTRDGRGEAVTGIVMMLLGENSRTVVEQVKARMAQIEPTLPESVTIDVFYDRADLIARAIATVEKNLLEGGLLVVGVLLLTLGNLRGGLIVATAIPLSMLAAFIGMRAMGVSGNLMSLGAIDFGLLVDGSVVMIENIVRVVGQRRKQGLPVDRGTVLEAAREVGRPIVFAVGIIILVYLPLLTLTGIEGKMFRPMATTVVFALLGSLVLALTLMPVLATFFLMRSEEKETALMRAVHGAYVPLLGRAMAWRRLTVGAAIAVFAASLAVIPFLGAEFVPRLDEGAIALQIARLPSVSLEESIRQAGEAERVILAAYPDEVATVVSKTGRAEIATDPMGVDFSDVFVMLDPVDQWTKVKDKAALVEGLQALLAGSVPGANFSFSQPIELRVNELIEGVRSDVAVQIYGDDTAELARIGTAAAAVLRQVRGAEDVKVEQVAGLPVLRIVADRPALARLGMDARAVLDAVEALGGRPVGVVIDGPRRYDIQVRFPEAVRANIDRIGEIVVGNPAGTRVPLKEVATLSEEPGPAQVSHENLRRKLTVELNVRGRDIASFVAEAQDRLDAGVEIPAGYEVAWGGQFENLREASARLAIVVPLVLLLIFVLLQAAFGSVRLAALVFANVPLAISGGVFALAIRGLPFSISAGVGFIALFGIAVMNGVVLVTYIRKLHEEGGVTAAEAARAGAAVLMTALVAALGFLPMALATSAGAEVQRPLATVVIGGLVTSTFLTLVVLPALYAWGMGRGEAGVLDR
jgi:cobalt-zinc-cadmium resistance protein CzcA